MADKASTHPLFKAVMEINNKIKWLILMRNQTIMGSSHIKVWVLAASRVTNKKLLISKTEHLPMRRSLNSWTHLGHISLKFLRLINRSHANRSYEAFQKSKVVLGLGEQAAIMVVRTSQTLLNVANHLDFHPHRQLWHRTRLARRLTTSVRSLTSFRLTSSRSVKNTIQYKPSR